MKGREITITYRTDSGRRDPGNDIVWTIDDTETVSDVLVAPGTSSDATETTRPDGVDNPMTFYMPRSWTWRSLRNALIRYEGVTYRVIGDPQPYGVDMTPTDWGLAVTATISKG
ncbi:hypothetical protein [Bifidobacterium callitrichos]|uniref:Phage protein n=1 Tax=Bifidobacterium callitrichos DSM 23973 TaxID=1437609 RepID=A0A087ACT1_9BIFI|nr:hypothetical protein [Bifidobacterium callitrichos]KFI56581.1 phage protein [Bifidobacterium callitrichos DSM 23973]